VEQRLVCRECGCESDEDALGWQAFLSDDPRDDDPVVTVVFCPACALREFGLA
jgi:hypothetical protein